LEEDSVASWIWTTHMGMGIDTAGTTIAQGVLAQFQIMTVTLMITTLTMALVTGSAITVTGHHMVIMAVTVTAWNIFWKAAPESLVLTTLMSIENIKDIFTTVLRLAMATKADTSSRPQASPSVLRSLPV